MVKSGKQRKNQETTPMSILVGRDTRLMVQGITGREGSFHALRSREYGANLVSGVTPGRGGQMFDGDVPVYNTVEQAVAETGADASLIFVPPPFAADAIVEAADAGIKVIACITEGIPVMDTVRVVRYLKGRDTTLIGPNCPGIISPGENFKMGIMPGHIHMAGRMGVVSRSGTLTYEAVGQLTELGIGQSTCVGIGGDPVNGSSFVDILRLFEADPDTDGVVMIGEIGGAKEQEAAEFIGGDEFTKPVRRADRRAERAARQAHGTRGRDNHRQRGQSEREGEGASRRGGLDNPSARRDRGDGSGDDGLIKSWEIGGRLGGFTSRRRANIRVGR